MTRILSYNIYLGGTQRLDQLTSIIRSTRADIVGLAEATDPHVVEELARRLDMQFCLSGQGKNNRDWQTAVLSRLPIVDMQLHSHPGIFTRKHLLEVCVEEPSGVRLTTFVTHLTAGFNRGVESNRIRRNEVQEILRIVATKQDSQHVLLGDFNSLAPRERLMASAIIRERERWYRKDRAYLMQQQDRTLIHRYQRYTIEAIVRLVIHNWMLSSLLDNMSPRFAQGGIDLLLRAGYVDCYRHTHLHAPGYTYSASTPACRIDYIFASAELARRLTACSVVTEGEGVCGHEASDHLAVCAEFGAIERA